jgi:hypothetical protein
MIERIEQARTESERENAIRDGAVKMIPLLRAGIEKLKGDYQRLFLTNCELN